MTLTATNRRAGIDWKTEREGIDLAMVATTCLAPLPAVGADRAFGGVALSMTTRIPRSMSIPSAEPGNASGVASMGTPPPWS